MLCTFCFNFLTTTTTKLAPIQDAAISGPLLWPLELILYVVRVMSIILLFSTAIHTD